MPYSASALPLALLDLTLLRVGSARASTSVGTIARWQRASGWRRMHQAAAVNPVPPMEIEEFLVGPPAKNRRASGSLNVKGSEHSNTLPTHPIQELERRVNALDEAIETEELAFQPFFYSENDLLAIYQDVLAVPTPEPTSSDTKAALEAVKQAEIEQDRRILEEVEARLLGDIPVTAEPGSVEDQPGYRRVLARAHEVLSRAEAARLRVDPNATTTPVPLAVLSIREFEALVRTSLQQDDTRAAEIALDVMKKSNIPLPSTSITQFLKLYAASGDSKAADEFLAKFLTDTPTESQRHLHILAHLNGTPKDIMPVSALDLLHHYENQNAAAPMRTYTFVISSLFARPSSLARAQAWDIFSHMRYVAHPNPDATLYTQMIRACANPVSIRFSSEPEKALDLWTEMTVDHKIAPTVQAYNAVILACARSGTKTYVNEAFRLARQMLDSHRDARGISAFRPDKKTFCALLEGTKRIGDLGRARWILAEMVRGGQEGEDPNKVDAQIDDEVVMHIFNTYAAYTPPRLRAKTLVVAEQSTTPDTADKSKVATDIAGAVTVGGSQADSSSSTTSLVLEEDDENQNPAFSHIPPQSRADVIREVKILFNRILRDRSDVNSTATVSLPFADKKFRGVELGPKLIGAYLSVFYRHATLDTSRELFWKIFEDLGLERTPRIYVEALERCGNARRGHERREVVRFADELWEKWEVVEENARAVGKPIHARMVERAHIAMMRTLAVTENLDRAMSQLRAFAAKYPPNDVRTPPPRPHFRSTRTSLVGQRALVRMTGVTEVPDDNVPPLMTFRDMEILHHRLIDEARVKDIKYVTWLCKAYEYGLRKRRDAAMKSKPVRTGAAVVASSS
ncbi:hypothetical protein M413DRAFT_445040 [Hebeloma cylindrosporum]|uniref:Pentacotripeptide-repeat region of PRORP domain-containing protein n=1 Tax=Hebeloma cylindrosporum TaxID=76867 RepID=A0A0C2XVZ5_HEBCY|nr:hypothetical protein M413DRAFT_445040 [Hebeloma cylindrosporum h7]